MPLQTSPDYDFEIKQHDTLPALRVQLQNKTDGSAVDLTNATTVNFIMSTDTPRAMVFKKAAVFEAPRTAGIVRYDWVAVDTAAAGYFIGEFEVTFTGGGKQTFSTDSYLTIGINPDLDGS